MGPGQKKLKNGATVIFIDEAGYSASPFVTRTWALKNVVPVLKHHYRRGNKLSAISGVAFRYEKNGLSAKLYFRIHPGKTIQGEEVVGFLYQLAAQIDGEIILVWDNLNVHKSKDVKRFLERHIRFSSVHLPPYCPELNPDEGVWNWTKVKDLANLCVSGMDELISKVRGSLRRIQRREHLLRWCLFDSELTWDGLSD